jgi:DNA-binding transcriptional ArsR family regulator
MNAYRRANSANHRPFAMATTRRLAVLTAPDLPNVAGPAALIGDPARAAMLLLLMDGSSRSAGELAAAGNVSPQSASGHFKRLVDGKLLVVQQTGRIRRYALAGSAVAASIEALAALRADAMPPHVRGGARMRALCAARHCYDHLAGRLGVALTELLVDRRYVEAQAGVPVALTVAGTRWLTRHFAVDVALLARRRRPLLRACVDWTERRPHVAGALGAAMLAHCRAAGWLRAGTYPRALVLTPAGQQALRALGVTLDTHDGALTTRQSA